MARAVRGEPGTANAGGDVARREEALLGAEGAQDRHHEPPPVRLGPVYHCGGSGPVHRWVRGQGALPPQGADEMTLQTAPGERSLQLSTNLSGGHLANETAQRAGYKREGAFPLDERMRSGLSIPVSHGPSVTVMALT